MNISKRVYLLSTLIYEHKPNIVFLQEITDKILQSIRKNNFILKYYNATKHNIKQCFGNVTLVYKSLKIKSINNILFSKTKMNRHFEEIIIEIQNKQYIFINTHLESYFKDDKIKLNQLEELFKKYNKNTIIGLDSNLSGKKDQKLLKIYGYLDSFIDSGEQDVNKYTYDYKTNKEVKGRYRTRLDRVYFNNLEWNVSNYKLIGKNTFTKYGVEISDHYGIFLEIVI